MQDVRVRRRVGEVVRVEAVPEHADRRAAQSDRPRRRCTRRAGPVRSPTRAARARRRARSPARPTPSAANASGCSRPERLRPGCPRRRCLRRGCSASGGAARSRPFPNGRRRLLGGALSSCHRRRSSGSCRCGDSPLRDLHEGIVADVDDRLEEHRAAERVDGDAALAQPGFELVVALLGVVERLAARHDVLLADAVEDPARVGDQLVVRQRHQLQRRSAACTRGLASAAASPSWKSSW